MHIASQALAIERQASAQSALAERVSRPKTRAILGLMRLNFLSVTASQALAIERQASAQPSLAERVSRPKTRAILGLMRLNFLSVG